MRVKMIEHLNAYHFNNALGVLVAASAAQAITHVLFMFPSFFSD
jgi:hypothetical protein